MSIIYGSLNVETLSKAQLEVVLEMFNKDAYFVHNEGAVYQCWLAEHGTRKRIRTVHKLTGNYLHENGWLEAVEIAGQSSSIYYYVLSERAVNALSR